MSLSCSDESCDVDAAPELLMVITTVTRHNVYDV